MGEYLRDFGLIDRKGWLTFALCVGGLIPVVVVGLVGDSTVAIIVLAATSVMWCLLLQLTRGILKGALELAQTSTHEWQADRDLIQEMTDDYVATVHDLNRYNVPLAGVHLERMRTMLIKRYPDMKDEIAHVQHPINMTPFVI